MADTGRKAKKNGWIVNLLRDMNEGDLVEAVDDGGLSWVGVVVQMWQTKSIVLVRVDGDPDPFVLFGTKGVPSLEVSIAGIAKGGNIVDGVKSVRVPTEEELV